MRKVVMGLLSVSLATGMGVSLSPAALAAPPAKPGQTSASEPAPVDDLPNPLEDKRREMREQAVSDVVSGKIKPKMINGSKVVKVGETAGDGPANRALAAASDGYRDQYVELAREKTDKIFVILAEFGNERHPDYPDKDTDPDKAGPVKFDGPLHNQIPEPNRAVDNSTVWRANYSPDYYRKLYFGTDRGDDSVKLYYETQSSGRYTVDGGVSDWVKVQYNEARYGRSGDDPTDANGDDPAVCGSNVCSNVWALVRDAANQWVADRKAAGMTDAAIAAEMRTYDQWDRYDFDADGNFNESDGYIDHFQIVHSGGDEADGDPWQGEDALWSHRWYAYSSSVGVTGPANNLLGGTQIGESGVWIGDYTVQPENGGLSVFVHEYGHDLGLPDDYNVNVSADNSNEHWTLMAQSRLSAATDGGIGERAGDLGAWNKLQLGWLDYEVVVAKQKKMIELGPEEYNSAKPQAIVMVLPDKQVERQFGAPAAGSKQYFSGNADDLDNTMVRTFNLRDAAVAELRLKARYSIEADYDYLYVEASTDGTTWTALDGTVNGQPFVDDGGGRPSVTGSSANQWVDMVVPLTQYADQEVQVRFHYRTDGGVSAGGFFGDEIKVIGDGVEIFSDGAETDAGWALKGFSVVGTSTTVLYDHYYIAGHRSYVSYDQYLKTGPYFFGYLPDKPDLVDHYAYQEGLLISYWDTSFDDNDTVGHPGQGRNLYVDSRPEPIFNLTGQPWRARVQVYDAPFGLRTAESFTLHLGGQPMYIRGQAAKPQFDDTEQYWYEELPNHGVKLPAVGVKMKVLWRDGTTLMVQTS